MRSSRLAGTVTVLLVAGALFGCSANDMDSTGSDAPISASPSTSGKPSATTTPSSSPDAESPAPVDPQVEAPVEWTDEELIGACKTAWTQSGNGADWSDYSPDGVSIAPEGSGYRVTFASLSGGADRACTVSGTPSETNAQIVS